MPDYTPDTVVKLLKNVPLDSTYTDTRWFTSAGAQQAFFNGKVKKTYTGLTYQRVNNSVAQPRGPLTCRVPDIADNLYDCNYMMFQNSFYGSKWFYAFVKQVNYINPNNTEIVYEIDYLQTFMMDIQIKPSYVVREHASSVEDKPFANLTPEPITVTSWIDDLGGSSSYRWDLSLTGDVGDKIIVAIIPNDIISSLVVGFKSAMFSGIFSGAKYKVFTSASEVDAFINELAALNAADTIVSVFMSPGEPAESDAPTYVDINTGIDTTNEVFTNAKGKIYKIKNKKLLNGQFTRIMGLSDTGEQQIYYPENLYGGDVFKGRVAIIYGPEFEMFFRPDYIVNSANLSSANFGLGFIQNLQCTWNGNGVLGKTIRNCVIGAGMLALGGAAVGVAGSAVASAGGTAAAVKGTSAIVGAGNAMAAQGGMVGAAGRAIAGAVQSPVGQAALMSYNIADSVPQVKRFVNMLAGNERSQRYTSGSSTATFAMGMHGFVFRRQCPDLDTLEKIDTFFDMFGYAVNKVKMPNLQTRQCWNYVQLDTPCIVGSVPVQGMNRIKQAFSDGIRLWHVDEVGDYNKDNPITAG
jgi:hypothetical protein